MAHPTPYFEEIVLPFNDGIDDVIIDIVGRQYRTNNSTNQPSLHYLVYVASKSDKPIWVRYTKLDSIRDPLSLLKKKMLDVIYAVGVRPLKIEPDDQLSYSYFVTLKERVRCIMARTPVPPCVEEFIDKFHTKYPSGVKVIRQIYGRMDYPRIYGAGSTHWLVGWEPPYHESPCWIDNGDLWGLITCDCVRKIDDYMASHDIGFF